MTSLIALRGDPSDNIPGARGIGQKTAAELLRRYGDLEGVIAHAADADAATARSRRGAAPADLRRYLEVATMRQGMRLIAVPDDAGLDAESAARGAGRPACRGLAARLTA